MKIDEIFAKCTSLTMSKRHDYTSTSDNHENFKRSSLISSWFNNPDDKPYVVLIGTKLARLASLLDNKKPKNESIEDSFLDLINYCALWMERRTIHNEVINPGSIISEIEKYTCAHCHVPRTGRSFQDQRHGDKKFCCIPCLDFDKF